MFFSVVITIVSGLPVSPAELKLFKGFGLKAVSLLSENACIAHAIQQSEH